MPSHEIFVEHADLIERIIHLVCGRHQLLGADREDFAGHVRLRLLNNDAEVLKRFDGRGKFPAYLISVITHCFQDWRNGRWGKWRVSEEAKRSGRLAVQLETLTVRDKLTLDQAYELLRTNYRIQQSRQQLEELAGRLPIRQSRTFVSDAHLENVPAATGQADDGLRRQESIKAARAAATALQSALAQLTPEDQLILRMHYSDHLSIAQIARLLHLDQKPLYRRMERLRATLRAQLEAAGIDAATTMSALEGEGSDA